MRISEEFKNFLGYNYEINVAVPSNGNVGYYIGEQRIYRYNIFYHNEKIYFRMKFDNYSKYFINIVEMWDDLNYVKEGKKKITRWHITQEDTLIISFALIPEFVEDQINSFLDFSLEIINRYFGLE